MELENLFKRCGEISENKMKTYEPEDNNLRGNMDRAWRIIRDAGIKMTAYGRAIFRHQVLSTVERYKKDKELVSPKREINNAVLNTTYRYISQENQKITPHNLYK